MPPLRAGAAPPSLSSRPSIVRIVSWNVNSIKARQPHVVDFLRDHQPDLLCLQELKCIDSAFPREAIEDLGYIVETFGQKTYNGVALISRFPLEDVTRGLPGFEDEQSRYIEALVMCGQTPIRIASIYLPNGNPVEDGLGPKYQYKLRFMEALHAHAQTLLGYEEATILCGDYNIIPSPEDCYDPQAWAEDALFRLESRQAFRRIRHLGYADAFELHHPSGQEGYTFWDYQGGAFAKNKGIRIDHHLLSPLATDHLAAVTIHKETRALERPSDHVPIEITLSI